MIKPTGATDGGRRFTTLLTGLALSQAVVLGGADLHAEEPEAFRVWAVSCSHLTGVKKVNRESLAESIRQSEGRVEGAPAIQWDIMLDAGDLAAFQIPPDDDDGRELIRQYQAFEEHRREQVYNVQGNHDAPYYDQDPGSWFRKWVDPLSENTKFSGVDPSRRPFPIEGTWERYRFVAGNVLFLMLSDRNDAPIPVGRGSSEEKVTTRGGFPAGAVTRETFDWWKRQVLENQNKIIVTMHHHMLRETTTGSSRNEGVEGYHNENGTPGASYLSFIIEKDDPEDFQFTTDAHAFEDFLDEFHREHGKPAIDLWIGGHTHAMGPEDTGAEGFTKKGITETRWGVTFVQVGALTPVNREGPVYPMSRVLTFADAGDELSLDVYLHSTNWKPWPKMGWYPKGAGHTVVKLRHDFRHPGP